MLLDLRLDPANIRPNPSSLNAADAYRLSPAQCVSAYLGAVSLKTAQIYLQKAVHPWAAMKLKDKFLNFSSSIHMSRVYRFFLTGSQTWLSNR
jgi:hypothetical protein